MNWVPFSALEKTRTAEPEPVFSAFGVNTTSKTFDFVGASVNSLPLSGISISVCVSLTVNIRSDSPVLVTVNLLVLLSPTLTYPNLISLGSIEMTAGAALTVTVIVIIVPL